MGTKPVQKQLKQSQKPSQEQLGANTITVCTKCDRNFEGSLKECPICMNKAYLRFVPKSLNSIVITEDNREKLEYHCKTIFPDDVIAVVPSVFVSRIGTEELEEQVTKQQKLRQQAKERAKRKAEKQREEEKEGKKRKKS